MYYLNELDNGIRIITCPLPSNESTSVGIWVRVGGRYESKRISGVSHFIEHMLFKGTRKRTTRQIKEAIEGVGGMLNAFTSEECTCYMARVLKKDFESSLDVLADMVKNATMSNVEIKRERTVILEEIKMYYDLPMHFVHELLTDLLWPNQSLGNYIAGTPRTVMALKNSDIKNFKQKHYHPKNIVVSVFGDTDPEKVVDQVRRLFPEKSNRVVSTFRPARSRLDRTRTHFVEKKTEQTHFVIGLHCGSRNSPERYKIALLNVILGGNMSSRLFEEVREKRGLAYSVRSGISAYSDAGALTISAGVDDRNTLKAVRVILRELEKLSKVLVPEAELRRAKDYFTGQLLLGLEDNLEHMLWAGERYLFTQKTPDVKKIREEIESTSASDIRTLAKKLFQRKRFAMSLIGPTKEKVLNTITRELS